MSIIVLQFFLVISILIFSLAVKSSSTRILLFNLALVISLPIFFVSYPGTPSDILYSAGFWVVYFLFVAFDMVIIRSNAQETIKANHQKVPASQLPILSRLKWAAALLFNFRGANWNFAAPGLRYRLSPSRWQFVLSQFVRAGLYYLLGDIISVYARRNPAFQHPTEPFGSRGLLFQGVNVFVFWTLLMAFMNRQQTLFSAIFVALGISDPEDWPAFFGDWTKTKSMRTFWGRSWHQTLRRTIQPHAKYLAQDMLHLSSGSLTSRYTQLFICFILSGVLHVSGDWPAVRSSATALDNIKFFIIQAAFVTLEDFIIFIGKTIGVTKIPSVLSYAWVIGWMTLSCPMWMETMVAGQYMAFVPEVSLVETLSARFTFT